MDAQRTLFLDMHRAPNRRSLGLICRLLGLIRRFLGLICRLFGLIRRSVDLIRSHLSVIGCYPGAGGTAHAPPRHASRLQPARTSGVWPYPLGWLLGLICRLLGSICRFLGLICRLLGLIHPLLSLIRPLLGIIREPRNLRCPFNMAHTRQSKPDSVSGGQAKVLKTFSPSVFPNRPETQNPRPRTRG